MVFISLIVFSFFIFFEPSNVYCSSSHDDGTFGETSFSSSGSSSNDGGRPSNQNGKLFLNGGCDPNSKITKIKCGIKLNKHCLCIIKTEDGKDCAFHMTSKGLSMVALKEIHKNYMDDSTLVDVGTKYTVNQYIAYIDSNYISDGKSATEYVFGRNCVFTCVSILNFLNTDNGGEDVCLLSQSLVWYAWLLSIFPTPARAQLNGIADQTKFELYNGKTNYCEDYTRYCGSNFIKFLNRWGEDGRSTIPDGKTCSQIVNGYKNGFLLEEIEQILNYL